MLKKLLIYSLLLLLPFIALSQSLGDYRSVNSGNWMTLSSWQYFNGTTWVTPSGTSPQGYPGQFLGTGAVLIQAGNSITIGQADLTTQVMGTLTINGTLNLDGGTSGVFTINTQNIVITSGLTPYANISFANKVTLALPANASIQVGVGGLPTPGNGTCNNNIEISIGGSVLAYCTGSGSPKADYTFTDIINNGGYNYVNATASPSSFCGSGSSTITALATPVSGATYKWFDAATGGTLLQNGGNTFNTGTISSTKTYYVDASYTSPAYTTVRKAVTVSVNLLPTAYTVTGGGSYCSGGTGVLVGLSNSTLGVNYQLQIGGVNTGGVVAGTGSAISFGLKTIAGNYTVIATNATTSCALAMTDSVSLTVNPSNTVSLASSMPTLCINTLMTSITHSTTNATGIGTVTGLPAGVTASWASNNITISGTPTVSGTFNYTIPLTGGCGSVNATGTITVNAAPIISTQPVSQLDCEGSLVNFKVIASGTNLTYTWFYKRPTDASFIMLSGVVSNTTYPNAPINNEISLANVGGAQYPNGTQFQVVVSNGTCSVTSNTVVLSVNEISAITSPTLIPSQSVVDVKLCYGSNYSYTAVISNPSNGPATYQWKSQIPSGSWNNVVDGPHFSGATTATLNIINGSPAESAKYRVDVVYNRTGGNCSVSSFSKVRSLTFYPLLTIPVATILQPDCITNTATITVTAQSTTDVYSFDNGVSYQASNVKSGLTAGSTYNVFIKNVGGCISPVKSSNINAASVQAVWNGSWTNGPPTSTQAVVFNSSYTIAGDMEACSCQVNSGSVTVNSGVTLKITNGVTVSGGTLTFNDSSSLVQINNTSNSGNIFYKRTTPAIIDTDYVYWSSPVSGFTLGALSPNTLAGKMYSYDAFASPEDWRQESSGTVMTPGKGYIVRGPEYAPPLPPFPSPFSATFVGIPNNGTITIPIGGVNTSNLIGNPYPSALDADLFLSANSAVLEGTIYFWTHNTAIQLASNIALGSAGSGAYAYTSDDYASYNFTGGVGVGTPATTLGFNISSIPSGKIASGQSFFATSIASGQVATFNNGMRVDVLGAKIDNSQFFKNASNSKSTEVIEKNRIWLNLTNTQGAFKQTLVGYVSGATNDYDSGYDGESYDGNEFIDFYSVYKDKNLVIQGRGLPFDENDTIPLGYRSEIEGDFTIAIDEVDGLFKDQNVFIEDKLLDVIHDLKNEAYHFSTAKGVFDERFVLVYTNKKLGTDEVELTDKTVMVSSKNKEVKIASSNELIDSVMVYDFAGKQIYKKGNIASNNLFISSLVASNSPLIVKVKLQNGQITSQKIVY
tara:strand:- start:2874 stop:6785 length:3912 start_codon:yes stop_codon:yes gene_type:complete